MHVQPGARSQASGPGALPARLPSCLRDRRALTPGDEDGDEGKASHGSHTSSATWLLEYALCPVPLLPTPAL